MSDWFGASWGDIARVVTSTIAIYATAVVALRVAGRRTVSQMSAFDVVVTIAMGSVVASTALSADPSYGHGLAALLTLLTAQQIVAVIRQRVPASRQFLDFSPEFLYRDGEFRLRANPLTAQVIEQEIISRVRHAGVQSFDDVRVVILEPNGEVSVLSSGASDLWDLQNASRDQL